MSPLPARETDVVILLCLEDSTAAQMERDADYRVRANTDGSEYDHAKYFKMHVCWLNCNNIFWLLLQKDTSGRYAVLFSNLTMFYVCVSVVPSEKPFFCVINENLHKRTPTKTLRGLFVNVSVEKTDRWDRTGRPLRSPGRTRELVPKAALPCAMECDKRRTRSLSHDRQRRLLLAFTGAGSGTALSPRSVKEDQAGSLARHGHISNAKVWLLSRSTARKDISR